MHGHHHRGTLKIKIHRLAGEGSLTRVYSLPLTVGERDALRRHLEVDGGRGRQGVGRQRLADRLGDGLGPRERLHVHGVDVENVAR